MAQMAAQLLADDDLPRPDDRSDRVSRLVSMGGEMIGG